jgi:Domain of unknown function (DUF4279)/SEC-C motif
MSEVNSSTVALRIIGDDLVPEEITAMLGASPNYAVTKGQMGKHIVGPKVGDVRMAKSGMWTLDASDREPEDMNGQVCQILSQMTGDIAVWQNIVKRYRAELFCGLFLNGTYGGLTLSPQTLATLGERGIEIGLCIYAEEPEISPTDQCPCKSGKSYAECCAPKLAS